MDEAFAAMTVKNVVFWDVTRYGVVLVRTDISEERIATINT
jgi:hypothetical protein